MPFVLGHALSMQAIHGGQAKHDKIDAQKIAGLRRGGMLPHASVSPAEMRATRDRLRRRMPLMRQRAELLTHVQHTNCQYHWPEIGTQIAYQTNRAGVAERCPDPAVQQSVEVARALIDCYDRLRSDLERAMVKTAQPHDADTFDRRQSVPGLGKILARVLRYAIHDLDRLPRVPDCVSSCRLVTCAKASAGTRYGTSGTTMGNASLTWAFSEVAVRFLRAHPVGQKSRARLEKTPGKGQAFTVLAPKLARAVYDMGKRRTAFARPQLLNP